jgi:hypothetical protein
VKVFRPIPTELRDVPEVKVARYVLLGSAILIASSRRCWWGSRTCRG